jgi:hypothetical protein
LDDLFVDLTFNSFLWHIFEVLFLADFVDLAGLLKDDGGSLAGKGISIETSGFSLSNLRESDTFD